MSFNFISHLKEIDTESVSYYPPTSWVNLRQGLLHYYQTYSIIRGKQNFPYFGFGANKVILDEDRSHAYIGRYFTSITAIHSFYEHLLNTALDSGKLKLSCLRIKDAHDIVLLLANKHEQLSTDGNTIEYTKKISLLEAMMKQDTHIPELLRVNPIFHFLIDHSTALKHIGKLRNDIVHQGAKTLLRYHYECLFINQIIPLVEDTLSLLEKSKVYIQKSLYCGVNVISTLRKQTLPHTISRSNIEEAQIKLRHINHLKELGRAAFENPLWMKADTPDLIQREHIHRSHNLDIITLAEKQAQELAQLGGYFEIFTCPCCGADSFVTYDLFIYREENNSARAESGKCTLCSYSINAMLGEPSAFGIMTHPVFVDPRETE